MINWTIDLNTIGFIVVGVLALVNTYYTRRTEKNTNSMKDALVASTGKVAFQAGKDEATVEAKAEAATLAKGVMQGKAEASPGG